MFSFTTENKFGFISNIFTVGNFRSFFLFQIEEKKIAKVFVCFDFQIWSLFRWNISRSNVSKKIP